MLINWFTILAQIINFLVLVALLKHFLWGKLVRAIDQREARISAELASAEERRHAAQQQMEQVRAVALEQERKGDEMIFEARKEADKQRITMIDKSRDSVRAMEARWQEDLDREKATFLKELRKQAATEILTVARQALADLASADLQRSAIEVFLEKLRSFDVTALGRMGDGGLAVRTATELPNEIQEQIRTLIAERMRLPHPLRFERDPDMAWGIELRGDGLKIGWSPESYLDAIEEKLKTELEHDHTTTSHVATG